ncbi:MAG: hypothetical protein R3F56_17495 [Planctomycetota bacterium]
MRVRSLGVVAGVGLIAVVVALAVRRPGTDHAVVADATPSAATSPETVEPPRSGRRDALAASPTSNSRSLRVTVVDALTQTPVAGATVFLAPAPDEASFDDARWSTFERVRDDPEAMARAFGQVRQTTADGTVTLQVDQSMPARRVIARAGTRYGEVSVGAAATVVHIDLIEDRALHVEVIGPHGRGVAGVQLALALRWADRGKEHMQPLGRTDADGRLAVGHLQVPLAGVQRLHDGPPTAARLQPRVPGLAHPGLALDLTQPLPDPVRIVLPATGRLLVELGWRGEVRPSWFFASVQEVDAAGRDATPSFHQRESARPGCADIEFAPIGLGARFRVEAQTFAGPLPARVGVGPVRPDQPAVFHCELDDDQPVLVAALTGADGTAAIDATMQIRLDAGAQTRFGVAALDAQGRLFLPLERRLAGAELRTVEMVRSHRGHLTRSMLRVEPHRAIPNGALDLGPLRMTIAPLVAAGTIRNQVGLPRRDLPGEVRPAASAHDSAGRRLLLHRETPDLGRFALYGLVDDEALEFVYHENGPGTPPPISFRRGATDVDLVVFERAEVRAEVAHDLPLSAMRQLRIDALGPAPRTTRTTGSGTSPRPNGHVRLRVGPLDPGTYTIAVMLAGDPTPLASLPDVVVGIDRPPDQRLLHLDVRSRVRLVRVDLLDGAAQPARASGSLRIQDPFVSSSYPIDVDDGRARVPIGSAKVDATLRVSDFATQVVRDLDSDRVVTLASSTTVRVRVSPPLALPGGVTLKAFVRDTALPPNPLFADRQAGSPIASQEFEFGLAHAGTYALTLVLSSRSGTTSVALPAHPATALLPSPSGEPVPCTVEPAALARALAELAK